MAADSPFSRLVGAEPPPPTGVNFAEPLIATLACRGLPERNAARGHLPRSFASLDLSIGALSPKQETTRAPCRTRPSWPRAKNPGHPPAPFSHASI